MDTDESDEGYTTESTRKRKKSRYQLITASTPMCAVVINNQTFDKATGLDERRRTCEDVKRLTALKMMG